MARSVEESAGSNGTDRPKLRVVRCAKYWIAFSGLALTAVGLGNSVEARSEEGIVLRAEIDRVSAGRWSPVAAGLPLPPGWLRDPERVRVTEAGRPLPTQTSARALWPDGSVRWLGLDWLAPPGAVGWREFGLQRSSLQQAAGGGRLPSLELQRQSEDLVIDTGVLRVRIPRHSATWFEIEGTHRKSLQWPAVVSEIMVNGRVQPAREPDRQEVVQQGPVRVRVERRGLYGNGDIRYVVRLDLFAGLPLVRVFHTFEVHADLPGIHLDRVTVRLPNPRGKHLRLWAGQVESKPVRLAVGKDPLWLTQTDADHFSHGTQQSTGRLSGVFSLASENTILGVSMRDFWQQFPQAVGWSGQRWEYDLRARQAAPALAGTGAAKTHEFVLSFERAGEHKDPLLPTEAIATASFDAEWAFRSRAMRNMIDPTTPTAKEFLDRLRDGYERVQKTAEREEWDDRGTPECSDPQGTTDRLERRRRGFYGMWNWGDWNFPGYHDDTKGCDAWGNLEYDLTQVLALAYAATSSPSFVPGLISSARHFMDVDIIHAQPRYPQWIGMNHPKNPLHWSFEKGGVDPGHTWTEGLLSYYLITGDERALMAAKGIGEFLLRRLRSPFSGNPRQFGWPQIALVALYETTGDPRFLEGARQYAKQGMARHQPAGIKEWKLGILAEGLAYVHSRDQDPAIWQWLNEYAEAVWKAGLGGDARLWPAVAYVAVTKGRPDMIEGAQSVVRSLKFGNWAKPFTIAARVGFSVLSQLQRGGWAVPQSLPSSATPQPRDNPFS